MGKVNDVLSVTATVDLVAKTDGFTKALHLAAAKAGLSSAIADEMVSGFKKGQVKAQEVFAATVKDAVTTGLGKAKVEGFIKKFGGLSTEIETSLRKSFKHEALLRAGGLSKEQETRLKMSMEEEKARTKMLHTRMKVEQVGAERSFKRRKEALVEAERLAGRVMSEQVEDATESLTRAFDDLKSANVGGMLKGAGKRTGAWGAGLKERGEAAGGMKGAAMQGIAKALSALGPGLLMLGAVIAGFAALVKIILDADSAAKELHRTLLENGTAALDLTDKYGNVAESLTTVREAFTDMKFNMKWGTTAKDHISVLNAYAASGRTFKEITGNIKDTTEQMNLLREATEGAVAYGKILGETADTMAGHIGTMMEEMAVTQEGALENFSKISKAAMESGFSTKRFFNMVLQATSGMSMYNVRLEDTVGLLLKLTKVLGAKVGAEFMDKLNQGYKSASTEERTRAAMTMGGKGGQIAAQESQRQAGAFADLVAKFQAESTKLGTTTGADFSKALADSGLSEAVLQDPKALSASLSKMSEKDSNALYAKLVAANADLAGKFQATWIASMGNKGDTGGVQAAMQEWGASATLLSKIYKIQAVTGQGMNQVSYKDIVGRMATEGPGGIGPDEFMEIKRLASSITGFQTNLEETRKAMKADPGNAKALAEAFNKQFGAMYEANLTEKGGLISTKTNDVLGSDFDSLMSNWTSKIEDMQANDQVKEDIELAQIIADNTTDMSKILEQGVEALLMKIYTAVASIKAWFVGGLNEDDKRSQIKALEQLDVSMEKLYVDLGTSREKAGGAIAELRDPRTSPERKKELRETLKAAKAEQDVTRKKFQDTKKLAKGVRDLDEGSGWLERDFTVDDILQKARGKAGIELTPESLSPADTQILAQRQKEKAASYRNTPEEEAQARIDQDMSWSATEGQMPTLGDLATETAKVVAERDAARQKLADDFYAETLAKQGRIALAGQKKNDKEQTKAQVTADKANFKTQTDILENPLSKLADMSEQAANASMASQLVGAGVAPEEALRMAGGLRSGNLDMSTMSPELKAAILGNPELASRTDPKFLQGLAKPAANDFLAHISGGQVKLAQRVDHADQVDVLASKSGGAFSSAAGKAGGGGMVVVNHNYNDGEGVRKTWRSLQAARALG